VNVRTLIIQPARHIDRIILPYMAYLAVLYSSTLSDKRHDLREHIIEHMTCVQNFSANFV